MLKFGFKSWISAVRRSQEYSELYNSGSTFQMAGYSLAVAWGVCGEFVGGSLRALCKGYKKVLCFKLKRALLWV